MTFEDVLNGSIPIHSLQTREMLMILADEIDLLRKDMNWVMDKLQDVSFQED